MIDTAATPQRASHRTCSQCNHAGPDVTAAGAIDRPSGPPYVILACPTCTPAVRRLLDRTSA